MTAINPARLKTQTAEIGELIGQAEDFTALLHELLSFYSARVRQTSLSRTHLTLQTYQVPEPVIQVLKSEITERLEQDAEAGYALVDALWEESWLEFRQLAIFTLGILPTEEPDRILNRIKSWLGKCTSEDIRRLTMTKGLNRLSSEKPDLCLTLVEELINSGSKSNHQAALFGLELFAADPSYPNLPLLFRFLSKILMEEENGLGKEISALLLILADRSEQETTYFLAKQLETAYKPRIIRVIRQVMKKLSRSNQDLLRIKIETSRT